MAIDTYLPTPDQLRNIIQQRTSGLPEYTEPTPNLPQGMTDYAQHNRAFHNFNNDPLQSKRDEIERATVRKQQQMGLLNREAQEEDTRLIDSGATPEQLQAHQDRRNYLQSLDEGTRLNLFLQGNDDPYLARDLNSMTANQLSVKYGKQVADYANQLSLDRMALTQQANYRINREDTTPTADLIQNMGGAMVEGIGNITSGLANAGAIVYGKVTGDTEGVNNYIQSEGAGAAISQLGRNIQSDDMALARKRNEATDQILEQNKERRALELSEEMTPDNARSQANLEQDLNQINAYFGRNTFAADVAQQVPEFLTATATGGSSALAARGALALATKQGVSNLTKEAAEQVIKASAIGGIGAYTGLREGEGGYRTAFDDVMSMDPTEVANSPEGQKLKQQDPTLTDTQIQREIASRAGNLAFNTTGALGAGIGLLASRAELSFSGLNPTGSVKQAIKGYGKDVGSETAEEGSQGIASTVAPRLAINEALGYEKYRTESGDLTQGAIYSAFEGAVTAAGSTSATNSPNVIKTTGQAVSQGLQQGYEAVKQKGKTVSENMTGKKASEEMEDLYSPKVEPTESNKATDSNTDTDSGSETKPNNLYGFTTNYKDSKLNQAFDNLDTELKFQLGEDSPIYKKLGSNQNAKLDALKSIAESAYETSQNPNAMDEQKALAQTQMDTYDDIITSLREGYNADLTARRESINKREEELFSAFHKMRNEFVQSKPEEYESFMSDLVKQAQGQELNIDDIAVELVRKYDPDMFNSYVELLQVDDAFNRVQEANNSNPILMKINDTLYRNRETVEDKKITLDVSKQTLDVVENQPDLGKSLDHLAKVYADKASKLNPQDSDYRAKKEALDNQFQAMFLKINARKQLQKDSIKQEWGKALDGLGKFRKVLKDNGSTIEQGAISSLFNTIQRIGKRIQDNPRISDAEALTLYEKFIGSNKNKGLLNYMQEAIRNKGVLSPNSLNSLHHFVSTQQFKNNLIENLDTFLAEIENTAKKEGKTLGKDFSFTWNNLSSKGQKTKQQGSNEVISFKSREAFIKYGKRATSDMALFTEVINQILDKPINISTKQTVKPTVKPETKQEVKQETKPEVKQEIKETIKPKAEPKVEPVQEQKTEDTNTNVINIHSSSQGLGQKLSNLYPNEFSFFGIRFPSVEHFIAYVKATLGNIEGKSSDDGLRLDFIAKNANYKKLDTSIVRKHRGKEFTPFAVLNGKDSESFADNLLYSVITQMLAQQPKLLHELQQTEANFSHTRNGKELPYGKVITSAVQAMQRKADTELDLTKKQTGDNLIDYLDSLGMYEELSGIIDKYDPNEKYYIDELVSLDTVLEAMYNAATGKEVSINLPVEKESDSQISLGEMYKKNPPVTEQKQDKSTVPVKQETVKTEEPVTPVVEQEETKPINVNQAGQFMLFDDVYVETNEFGEPLTEEEVSSQNVPENQLKLNLGVEPTLKLTDTKASLQVLKNNISRITGLDLDQKTPEVLEVEAEARLRGVSWKENFIENYGVWHANKLIPQDKLQAIYRAQQTKRMTDLDLAIQAVTGKPATVKDREYFEGYFNIYRTIANRLFGKNQATGTEGGFTDNLYLFTKVNSTATQADRLGNLILRLNPIFNFMNFEINDKGKQRVTVPSELIQAMTNAVVGSIVKESSRSANAKQVYEQLRDHDPRPAFLVGTTNHQRLANGNLKTFNEQLMTEGSSLNQSADWTGSMEGYGSLGSEEQTLIKTIGEAVLENLGLSFNGKHNGEKLSATVKQSIAFGLGSELYDELNNMNVLKKTRMIYFDTIEGKDGKAQLVPANYINFTTFHWNNNFESYIPNKKGKTNELLSAEQIPVARKAIQNEYQKLLRSTQRDYSNMDKLSPPYNPNKGFFGDVLKVSLNSSSEASKAILGDTAKESKGISLEPFKANPKNINSMLTTGKNQVALDFLDEFNKIKWAVDVPFYGLLRQAEPVFKTLLGVIDPATYDSIKADKESRMSLTNQINRSFDLAYEHFNEDYENLSLQDKRFYIKHSLVSTQRVRQDSAFNPQNVKLDREILLPVNTLRNEDGTEITHESVLKLNKLSRKYSLKTNIKYFVGNVLKDYKKNQADDTALGTVMALAQALGFKIEKQLDQTVLENFRKWIDSDEAKDVIAFAEYVRDVKTDSIDDINGEQYHQLASRLFDQYGNATAGLAKVTSTLADIDLMLNGKLNQAHITLMIEMDGIGNGVNNSNRQFSTSFTGHYINTLKRTGNVTMDLIAQGMANGLTIEEIQGSKFIFDRKNKPLDVYEVVSDQMLKDIQGTTEKMIKALKIVTEHLRIKEPSNLMDILQHPEINRIVNDPKTLGDDGDEYAQMVFNQANFLMKKVRAIILVEAMDSFDSKLDVKTYNLINDFKTPIAKKIARGLAKTAVTPTNYGGKLDGITQQAMLDLKAALKAKAKEFYLALKSDDQERTKEAYVKLHTLIVGLGMSTQWTRFLDGKPKVLQLGSPEQFNQMLETYGKSDEFKEVMTQLAESYSKITPFNGDKVTRNVKFSLGSQLFTSISNVYKEQFENIDTAIQANTLMFRTFLIEYLNKIKYREEQRNKENGWVDDKGNITDVRAYDALSSNEIKAILQSISSLPIIGTAMSNNEVLVNRLVDYGNTLAKKLKIQTDKNKRSIASSLTSKFIANRDEKAKYVVMTHVVSDLWRGFAEAGASALTSTIVSTESLSQALTARMLNELGLAGNDVYDGLLIDIAYRKAVSELINKHNNEAHFETNLLRENFHALNRSGLADFVKYTPEIKRMRDWFESKGTELQGITLDTFLEETNVTPEYLAQYLNTIVYVMGNDKVIKENYGELLQSMRLIADDVNNTVTKRLMGIEANFNSDMWRLREAFTEFSMENENPETYLVIKDLFQAKLFGLGRMAVKSEAMKRIEKEYFPMIVNQFGGISSGYIHNNPNENPKAKAVMDRFLAYVEQQNFDIKTHNFAADQFDLLSDFIDQDTELKEKLITIYKQELKKLNVTRVGSLKLDENQTIEKVSDLYNEEFTKQLSQNQRIVLDVLKPLLTTATGLDTKIYRDPTEFAKASGISESELTDSLGKFVLNNGEKYIYLAEPSEFVDSYTVGLHEIIHSAFDELSAAYFVQTESNPILDSKMTGTMRNLEFLMRDFAKRYHYEVGFRDALNTLIEENQIAQNEAENAEIEDSAKGIGTFKSGNIFANYSDLVAITASIEFAYNPDNGLSPQAAMQAKYTAFNEFLAYALSSQEILTKLQYTGRSGKIPVGVWDNIKKFFNRVKREIQALFGFTDQNKNTAMKDRAPENYLIDILTSVKVLSNVKPAKFEGIRAKLDRYKPTVLSYMKKHLNETEQTIFGYESNQAMDLGDMSEQTSFDTAADNSNVSDKHKEYLSALYGLTQHTLRDMLVNQEGIQNYPTEIALLEGSQVNQEANDLLIDMQTNGVVFSELERRMFKLAYALNKASFDGQNEKLRIEAERILNNIIDKIKPEEFLASTLANDGALRFGSVFNNKLAGDNNTAMIMAVVTTNESVKNYIENLMETNRSIGEKIKSRYDSLIMNRKANQFIGNISNKTIIEQLGLVSASLDFRNKLGAKRVIQIQEQQFQEELAKQQAYNQYSQFVDEHVPFSVLRDATKVSLGAMFSGQGYDSKSTDSTLGDVIRDLIESYDYMKGRPTLLSQFVNWILQASSKNQYAYRMRSSYTALSDSIREKLGNVVNAYIEDSFKNLTNDKRKATKLMLRTELHKVNNLRGLYGVNVKQVVADTKYRQQKIKEITDYLESEYVKVFPQNGAAIKNYLVYQTDALAEFSQKGITKSDSVEQAYVLTNTQNITRLQGTGLIGKLDTKELVSYVDALVSLKALNHIGSKDLGLITEMLETEPKATEIIFKEMNHTDKLESETNSVVSGYFGYRHNRWDSNFDVQVVNEQVTTEKEKREVAQEVLTLKLKGYEKVATLANGYSVYHSTQSLTKGYTTGVFNLAEYTYKGANYKTGIPVNSVGLIHKSNHTETDFAAAMRKVMQGTMDYQSHEYVSNTHMVYGVDGVTLFTMPSFEQTEKWIPIMEDDFQSIGNNQARKFEEELSIQSSVQNVQQLHDVYQKRKDKQNFVAIGEVSTLDRKYKDKADKLYRERIGEFYKMLPQRVKNAINALPNGVLMIEKHQLDNLIGYYQGSIIDPLIGKSSSTPEWFDKLYGNLVSGLLKIEGLPVNPIKALKYSERGLSEVVSFAKENVLIRSLSVPFQNLFSNLIHCVNVGIPLKQIVPLMLEGYQAAKAYINNEKEIIRLNHRLMTENLSTAERNKLEAKSRLLLENNNRNPVKPMMVGGIFTSLSEASDTVQDDSPFSLASRIKRWTKLDKVESATPSIVQNILMTNGSMTHTHMMNIMNYGDFIAKYAYYQHLTRNLQRDSEHAMDIIRDEFVNYNMNRGKVFDMLNKLGIFWFASYILGIQKVIYRNARRNFLRTALIFSAGSQVNKYGIDTVPNQAIGLDYSFYHTDPTNLPEALGSHWLWSLLKN